MLVLYRVIRGTIEDLAEEMSMGRNAWVTVMTPKKIDVECSIGEDSGVEVTPSSTLSTKHSGSEMSWMFVLEDTGRLVNLTFAKFQRAVRSDVPEPQAAIISVVWLRCRRHRSRSTHCQPHQTCQEK